MIIDKIENIEKYSQIPISVIKFIKNLTPETPVGHYELENGIFANIDEYTSYLKIANLKLTRNILTFKF